MVCSLLDSMIFKVTGDHTARDSLICRKHPLRGQSNELDDYAVTYRSGKVAVSVSTRRIGCDGERLTGLSEASLSDVCSADELSAVRKLPNEIAGFFALLVLKESTIELDRPGATRLLSDAVLVNCFKIQLGSDATACLLVNRFSRLVTTGLIRVFS